MHLKFIDDVYKSIFEKDLSYLVIAGKVLGASFIIVIMFKALMESFTKTGQVISKEKGGFSPYEMIRNLTLLIMIVSYNEILGLLDTFFVGIEAEASKHISPANHSFFELTKTENSIESILEKSPQNKEEVLTQMFTVIKKLLNPFSGGMGMGKPLELLMKMIDMIIYPLFLAERYFMMGIIKIFAPLLIAASIIPKYRDYVYNWVKIYARYFLVIIPFMFVNVFANHFHDGIFEYMNGSTVGAVTVTLAKGPITTIVLLFIIILKFKLYKKSLAVMKEIFP